MLIRTKYKISDTCICSLGHAIYICYVEMHYIPTYCQAVNFEYFIMTNFVFKSKLIQNLKHYNATNKYYV